MTRSDVVIGGGPAGAAVACTLAAAGQPVTLLERGAAPAHKVCGDFLSAGAVGTLAALGVDAFTLGAQPIDRMRLVHGRRQAESDLPFRAAGLSRFVLDEALLGRAAALGADVRRGVAVRHLDGEGRPATDRGDEIQPAALFLATGKHELRGARRPVPAGDLVGLKMYFDPSAEQRTRMARTVEIVLFDGGYAGLQIVEGGRLNLCALVRRRRLEREGGSWDRLLPELMQEQPHLGLRLAGAAPCLDRPLAVAGLPYGYMHRGTSADAVFRVGDQAAVIPSLAGDGVAIALASGRLAALHRLAGQDAGFFHRRLKRRLARPVGLAGLIHAACLSRRQGWMVQAARLPGAIPLFAAWTRSGSAPC